MANFVKGHMLESLRKSDLFLIVTNSYIKRNGELVMGQGIANEAREKFPGLASRLGGVISSYDGHLGVYGLLVSPFYPRKNFGCFQVKTDFTEKIEIPLIIKSTKMLMEWIDSKNDTVRVDLEFPIDHVSKGRGTAEIASIIKMLPDNVNVWVASEYMNPYEIRS